VEQSCHGAWPQGPDAQDRSIRGWVCTGFLRLGGWSDKHARHRGLDTGFTGYSIGYLGGRNLYITLLYFLTLLLSFPLHTTSCIYIWIQRSFLSCHSHRPRVRSLEPLPPIVHRPCPFTNLRARCGPNPRREGREIGQSNDWEGFYHRATIWYIKSTIGFVRRGWSGIFSGTLWYIFLWGGCKIYLFPSFSFAFSIFILILSTALLRHLLCSPPQQDAEIHHQQLWVALMFSHPI